MYVYLQVENQSSGVPTNRFHCRGEEPDEPRIAGFQAMMAKRGLEVLAFPNFLGDALLRDPRSGKITEAKRRGGGPGRPAQAAVGPGGAS